MRQKIKEEKLFFRTSQFPKFDLVSLSLSDCEATLKLLLKNGANPNAYSVMADGSQLSPLYCAVQVVKCSKHLLMLFIKH